MPPGYPGYTYICPHGLGYPGLLNSWVVVIGSFAYGLWIESALLAIGILWFRWRHRLPRGSSLSLGVTASAALVTSVVDGLIVMRNIDTCRYLGYVYTLQHWRPDNFADMVHALGVALAQANIAFGVAALMFLIGTFAAARVAVLGWRRGSN